MYSESELAKLLCDIPIPCYSCPVRSSHKMISVIIPTYRNTSVLVKNLKHNLPYLEGCEVVVVNDDPDESIKEDLNDFISVKLIENPENKGFSGAVNEGVRQSTGSYLFLLNNDVKLLNRSYENALEKFKKDDELFAVSFAQKEYDGRIIGKNEIYWDRGMIHHRAASNLEPGINAWAEGGSAIFDRAKYDMLNGFDELFSPFYWEDVDLSYRAWKSGFNTLFDPSILVEHHHETTIGAQFTREHINAVAYRNQLIFQWKNLSSWGMIMEHKINLLKQLLFSLMKGDTVFLEGWFLALKIFPSILKKRRTVPTKKSDHEILTRFTH